MLSKSAARAFFLSGTLLFSAVFIGLTVDTFQRIPGQTNASDLTESVVRGKRIWEENNCMGCHTLLGEGAYYAPELTRVYDRRGPAFIAAMLKDPESVYPGQRKMVKYDLSDGQIEDMVAFFEWIGRMDLNGFPPKPTIGLAAAAPIAIPGGERPEIFKQVCTACHSLGGVGGTIGPALDGVGDRFDRGYLMRWITDPQAVKPGTLMPTLVLTEAQRAEIVIFLSKQREAGL
jgi:nitric oxide reductase subunit C